MITLTNPINILSVLGGTATVGYETLVLTSLNVNVVDDSATGVLELPELGFFKKIGLAGPQRDSISTVLQALRTDTESGLVALGLVDGVQS